MRLFICSFRRSGNHWLQETIAKNLPPQIDLHKSHDFLDVELASGHNVIYLVRDGRDVTVSNYYWALRSQPARKCRQGYLKPTRDFSEFLRRPSTFAISGSHRQAFAERSVVEYWAHHVRCYLKHGLPAGVLCVKYEELKSQPTETIRAIAEHLELPCGHVRTVDHLVGHLPRRGVVGDWKNYFSPEDEVFFRRFASAELHELGYEP